MNKLIEKPYLIFLVSIPVSMLMGFLNKEAVLDINIYDTYFVISHMHLAILISVVFGITGIGYWAVTKANRKLSKWLTAIHIALTFGGMLIICILSNLYSTTSMDYEFNTTLDTILLFTTLVILIAQLVVPVNMIYGLIKK